MVTSMAAGRPRSNSGDVVIGRPYKTLMKGGLSLFSLAFVVAVVISLAWGYVKAIEDYFAARATPEPAPPVAVSPAPARSVARAVQPEIVQRRDSQATAPPQSVLSGGDTGITKLAAVGGAANDSAAAQLNAAGSVRDTTVTVGNEKSSGRDSVAVAAPPKEQAPVATVQAVPSAPVPTAKRPIFRLPPFGFFEVLSLLGLAVWLPFGVFFRLAYKAERPGILVSPSRNLIEFPGGGIAANSLDDYTKWSWLTQACRRYSAPLDEILAIDGESVTTTTFEEGKVSSSTGHSVSVTFPFGVVSFGFDDAAKRDQLYNVLRYVNRMGTPVFEA